MSMKSMLEKDIYKCRVFLALINLFLLVSDIKSLTTKLIKNSLTANAFSTSSRTFPSENDHIISVRGVASRTVQTDLIKININVQTLEDTMHESYIKNVNNSNDVTKVYDELNIPEKNITTSSYNLSPKYRSTWFAINNTWGKIFEGYETSNKMTVTLSDVTVASDLIEKVMNAANVLITGVSFDYSPVMKKKLQDKLLPLAAKDAFERAKVTGNTLRVIIDDVKTINVYDFSQLPIPMAQQATSAGYVQSLVAEAPILFSGKAKVDVSLNVDFLIMKE